MNKKGNRLQITSTSFGRTPKGEAVLFTMKNENEMTVKVTNYGGIITTVIVPDRDGKLNDVVAGFDNIDQYLSKHPHFGTITGRYGNRIAFGRFMIDGKVFQVSQNKGDHCLHGGNDALDKRLYEARVIEKNENVGVELTGLSPHLEEGFPGNLKVTVRYLLNNQNELLIQYEASSDLQTVINLTNHSYFNLDGFTNGDALKHQIMIAAESITHVDEAMIPTGTLLPIKDTSLDFLVPTAIEKGIDDLSNDQIKRGNGFDHNFVFSNYNGELTLQATAYSEFSGRLMEVLTTEPAIQLYSGNYLNMPKGKYSLSYAKRSAFCLETQHFPDSPNHPHFPSTLLKPGETFESETIYRFSIRES